MARGITIPNFKLQHRGVATTTCYPHKNRHTDQQNSTEDTDIEPYSYRHAMFDKVARNTHWKKEASSKMMLVKLDVCTQRNLNKSIFITLNKIQAHVDKRPNNKTRKIKPDEKKIII